ncbi:MAG: hydroxymethylglutaryl-CoA reductase, partial [Bacteroidetes bacterium]|nr:hydroxymethylglutaryl-CoA reductase [Bacteroidota bacterium]
MTNKSMVIGFSKLTREQKRDFVASLFEDHKSAAAQLDCFLHSDKSLQKRFEEFSENTISNYFLPYGIVPNIVINDEIFHLPMVIEESSVVAAASNSAKFWASRGGFHAQVLGMTKLGHVHFLWNEDPA